jgi:flavin reductase (DIM6/NTAB) family NADH-FMN oxidoreductase RutF
VAFENKPDPIPGLLQAIGKIPSGVFVLTTGHGESAVGMLISLVQQISLDPLVIALAVRKGRTMAHALEGPNTRFVLNITAATDKSLLKKYARETVTGSHAFSGIKHKTLPSGQTVLTDACAYLECELVKIVDFNGDHDLYIGKVLNGELLNEGTAKPTVHVRHDGSKY